MPEKLKDLFFSKRFVEQLAEAIQQLYPGFDQEKLLQAVYDEGWENRELKERMRHLSHCLHAALPPTYPEALEVLLKVAPLFEGFNAMVFPDYVECYGLEDWERSLPALAVFTRQASSEFAVRPFLAQDPERAMGYLYAWAEDENFHVRRLASEGCRPRLPWAMALPAFKKDPALILPVLEKLKADESDYVRRSVANNLNDISKDHPDLVLDLCQRWYGQSQNTDWVVKHACRSLLKGGNEKALRLFSFAAPTEVEVEALTLDKPSLSIGEAFRFSFKLNVNTPDPCQLRLEYKIHFVKSSGKLSPKIFQLKEDNFKPGSHLISRKHSFEDRTTRKHHPGQHQLAIIVNGIEMAGAAFELNGSPEKVAL
jgi:3-methyladenine DNA glycosylase AlkC